MAVGRTRALDGADTQHSRPSGPGKVIFVIHGHIDESDDPSRAASDGMIDDLDSGDPENQNYGDTMSLARGGIPTATIYKGAIGWHEMIKGQLIFTAPVSAMTHRQMSNIQRNLDRAQEKFLKP